MNNYELIDRMKEKLKQQDEMLQQMMQAPSKFAVIVRVSGERAVFIDEYGAFFEVQIPKESKRLQVGMVVKVDAETGAIKDVDAEDLGIGVLATVIRVVDKNHVEIETDSGRSLALISFNVKELKVGHRVVLDTTESIVMKNLGSEQESFRVTGDIGVTWKDIGGLAEAKQQLREAIELPIKNPEIFKRYGQKPVKGIMLYGPPGCGKTMLAKAAVSAVAELHGKEALSTGFVYVKGPEILSKWVGESEGMIRGMFHRSREHHEKNGYPAVIFLDEADAILGRRGSGRSSDMERTIVPQFLSEMDGLNGDGAPIVLIATNRPDTLDPAIVRDGRIDRKIRIDRPGRNEVKEIFSLNLRGKPVAEKDLEEHATERLFCASKVVARVTDDQGGKHPMPLSATVNGAMVAGIVGRSVSLAMRREMAGNGRGINRDDLEQGINENLRQMADVDLQDEVAAFAESMRFNPVSFERAQA